MDCCSNTTEPDKNVKGKEFETVLIEKTKNVCPMCENYAKEQAEKQVAILSCEGACLRGEISRQAANMLCYSLAPEKTVRICLGGAFTKDTGQRNLVRQASRVIAIEGCFIKCASRMMKGVLPDLEPEIVIADRLYEFDTSLFGVDQMEQSEIMQHSRTVADKIMKNM